MVSLAEFDPGRDWLTEVDNPKSNEAVRNLMLDYASSMIFQRIVASHRMSRMIDPHGPSPQQLQYLRQDARIRELRERQQYLYGQIRNKFYYIYRAEGQPVYDEYQQVKRDIDSLLKEKGRALKAQLQAD